MYEVSFKLGNVTSGPSQLQKFSFNVETLRPSFKVNQFGLRSSDEKNKMILLGDVETADFESSAQVEQLLTATQNGKGLPINWQHNGHFKDFKLGEDFVRVT